MLLLPGAGREDCLFQQDSCLVLQALALPAKPGFVTWWHRFLSWDMHFLGNADPSVDVRRPC